MPGTEKELKPENEEPQPDTPDPNTEPKVDVNSNNKDEIVIEDE